MEPENRLSPKESIVFQPSILHIDMLVFRIISRPLKSSYFEDPDPCYRGSNPSIEGSKDS